MTRCEIRTLVDDTAENAARLRRSIGRRAIHEDAVVRAVAVGCTRGCLRVDMDLAGPDPRRLREAERLFRRLWYDAFGDRSARHLARPA